MPHPGSIPGKPAAEGTYLGEELWKTAWKQMDIRPSLLIYYISFFTLPHAVSPELATTRCRSRPQSRRPSRHPPFVLSDCWPAAGPGAAACWT